LQEIDEKLMIGFISSIFMQNLVFARENIKNI